MQNLSLNFAFNSFLLIALVLQFSALASAGSSKLIEDIDVVFERRLQNILPRHNDSENAIRWQAELTADGIWKDIDYIAGCDADRAYWKAQNHIKRITTMSVLWYFDKTNPDLLEAIWLALDYWFQNDFVEDDCINGGGRDHLQCPCGTEGLWNFNWWYQMIGMPGLVGNLCLILKDDLTDYQFLNCTKQLARAYERIDGDPNGAMGAMTGANMLDVASVGVSLAILNSDPEQLLESINRYYKEVEYTAGILDGIKVDGAFMQHTGQILTGSYGAVFINLILKLFLETDNTAYSPPPEVETAFLTLMTGSEWCIYSKTIKDEVGTAGSQLMWQYGVIGRSLSHKYEDWNGIGFDIEDLIEGTKDWTNHEDFQAIFARLNSAIPGNVNPGELIGTKYFHSSDYLVHRGANYIVTLKMYSTRTINAECMNSQNPYAFHMSDGAIFTYLTGSEYTDVVGAWDWNLIPGTTVDYGVTNLTCDKVWHNGKEDFVGGLASGEAGIAVMNYTNPNTGALHWGKTYFFFPAAYAVQFAREIKSDDMTADVVTALDQRHLTGDVYVDGIVISGERVNVVGTTLWHDRVGYRFLVPLNLTVDMSSHESDWEAIGTSTGNEMHTLFAATVTHSSGIGAGYAETYIAELDIDQKDFEDNIRAGQVNIINEPSGAAVARGATFDGINGERIISIAFWTSGYFETGLPDVIAVETDSPILLMFKKTSGSWFMDVSDPTQKLASVQVLITTAEELPKPLNIILPNGMWTGSAVRLKF